MRPAHHHACVAAGCSWRPIADLGSGGSRPEGGAFSNGFASAGRVYLGGEEGAGAGAAPGLCRAEKGEGLGGEDPISPPCSRPLGRAPPMGLGEGAGSAPRALASLSAPRPGPAFGDCGPALCPSGLVGGGRGRRYRKRSGVCSRIRNLRGRRHFPPTLQSRQRLPEAAATKERLGVRPRQPVSKGLARFPHQLPAGSRAVGRSCRGRGLVPEEGRGGNAPENTVAVQTKNPKWLECIQLSPAFLGRARI